MVLAEIEEMARSPRHIGKTSHIHYLAFFGVINQMCSNFVSPNVIFALFELIYQQFTNKYNMLGNKDESRSDSSRFLCFGIRKCIGIKERKGKGRARTRKGKRKRLKREIEQANEGRKERRASKRAGKTEWAQNGRRGRRRRRRRIERGRGAEEEELEHNTIALIYSQHLSLHNSFVCIVLLVVRGVGLSEGIACRDRLATNGLFHEAYNIRWKVHSLCPRPSTSQMLFSYWRINRKR